MVNVGGPSKGCITCVRRKIRCDRQQPSCFQCTKSKRICEGYRNSVDFRFRDQSDEVIKKALSKSGSSKKAGQSRSSSRAGSVAATQQSNPPASTTVPHRHQSPLTDQDQIAVLRRSPPPDEDEGLTQFFANNFACSNTAERRSNLFWIPRNFDDVVKDESIRLSAQCTGGIALARLHRCSEYTRKAQDRYGKALHSVLERWRRGSKSENGAGFMAVLFLSFFEIMDSSSRPGWRTHLGGLEGLFQQCQEGFVNTHSGAAISRQVRSQFILNALQTHTPVVKLFASLCQDDDGSISAPYKHFDDVDALLIRLASLQALADSSPGSNGLLADLLALDKDLANWAGTVPSSWHPSRQLNPAPSGLWWDTRRDVYISGFIEHAWNKVRAAQIITHDLIRSLLPPSTPLEAVSSRYASFQGGHGYPNDRVRQLVTDICATIPTCYRPTDKAPGRRETNRRLLGTTFWYLWPLDTIGTMTEAPSELIDWIAQCFESMHQKTGILIMNDAARKLRTHAKSLPR